MKREYKHFLLTLWVVSSGSPPLMSIPLIAPTPVPTMTAVGVAKPRAHGHAILRTVMANLNACSRTASCFVRPLACKRNTVIQLTLFKNGVALLFLLFFIDSVIGI